MEYRRSPSRSTLFLKILAAALLIVTFRISTDAIPIVALIGVNKLVTFDSSSPGTITSSAAITGLPAGEEIIAIDFRPATGQLYGLGKNNRLYVINPTTRHAVQIVGNAPFSPSLNETSVGFDFDPARDRARVTVDDHANRQNLTIDPDPLRGGGASVETVCEFAADDPNAGRRPRLFGLAYDNNFRGTRHSVLYAIHRNVIHVPFLVAVAPGNGGVVRTIGQILPGSEPSVSPEVGFDISPVGGVAYALMKTNSPLILHSRLYKISLVTGAATFLGELGEQGPAIDLAIVPPRFMVRAVNAKNELISFDAAYPETILTRAPITGLISNEQIHELDFRPTGELVGLGRSTDGSVSRVYPIDPSTAVASSNRAALQPAPSGDVGFDFLTNFLNPQGNPRVVAQDRQNLLVHRDGFNVEEVYAQLAYAAGDPNSARVPNVVAAAHATQFPGIAEGANGFPPFPGFTLYDIDRSVSPGASATLLLRHGPPAQSGRDTGELFTVGQITGVGLPVDQIGFDIAYGVRGPALATFISVDEAVSKLYVLDLASGAATFVGVVDSSNGDMDAKRVRDLAIVPVGQFSLGNSVLEVIEDCTAITITVTRNGDISNDATVNFESVDGSGGLARASSRSDFTAMRGTLFFPAGESTATFDIPINEDSKNETGVDHSVPFSGETFSVTLSNPSAGYTLFNPVGGNGPTTFVFIRDDDDTMGGTNPIDDTQNFVCTQYHDFLNRQPDAGGLQFWTNTIENCGPDAQCREVRRIDVSAAFFLSIEFQETGYLAYRTYQAAFGRPTVPLQLSEFVPDTQSISKGVVVLVGNWEERLEENKRRFFDDFVTRPQFTSAFPSSLSAAQFIDALNVNAEQPLSQAERDQLVSRLDSGQITRAQVLRLVADDADLRQGALSRAFVLMQFFGYLRRNPNDLPDQNFDGYLFWLNKLNQFNGDFRRAEMVKAFISSIEYRRRFGQ